MKMVNTNDNKKLETTTIEKGRPSSKPYYVPNDLINAGLSKSFVYGKVKSGDIPSKRVGKKIFLDHIWVEETFNLDAT